MLNFSTAFQLSMGRRTFQQIRWMFLKSPQFPCQHRPLCLTVPVPSRQYFEKLRPIAMKRVKSNKPVAEVYDGITLRQLASAVGKPMDELEDFVLEMETGRAAEKCLEHPDEPLEREMVLSIVSGLGMRPVRVSVPKQVQDDFHKIDLLPQPLPSEAERRKRPPIVTIMGHVDHGKTTLLDALRHSNIVAQEYGGITQHIGAFSVKLPDVGNEPVTFLDTPGHAAFKAMRERGARATDIVVLVVAADDSVMEQTVESIKYAREAGVPIIVAINKCDKAGVDPEQVLLDLLQHDIVPEKYGGDTQIVQISALHGRGIDKLQEAILLQAELMQLRSIPTGSVEGTVIESSTAQGLGILSTLVVNRGTLKKGTILVAGTSWARVRTMTNEFGALVKEAGPSTPVRFAGWHEELPTPGELALEAPNEARARAVVNLRRRRRQEQASIRDMEVIGRRKELARQRYEEKRREDMQKGLNSKTGSSKLCTLPPAYTERTEEEKAAAKVPKLSIVVKSDVDGTHEALGDVLATYDSADQVRLDIVASSVGPLREEDLDLAAETGARILTFNAPVSQKVRELAHHRNVPLEQFHVIYKLVERLKEMLNERIEKVVERRLLGVGSVIVEYRLVDGDKKRQPVAGIHVESGALEKKGIWRFVRVMAAPKKQKSQPASGTEEGKEDSKHPTTSSKAEEEDVPTTEEVVLFEGRIESMQLKKHPINRATVEMQIGVAVHDKNVRYKEHDRVECYEEVEVPQQIRWHPPGF